MLIGGKNTEVLRYLIHFREGMEWELPSSRPLILLCSLTNSREQSYSTGYSSLHVRIPGRQRAPKKHLWISFCSDLRACWTNLPILHERGNVVKIQCSVLTPTPPAFMWKLSHWPPCPQVIGQRPRAKICLRPYFLGDFLGGLGCGLVGWLGFFWGGGFWFCFVFFFIIIFNEDILGIQVQVNWICISVFLCDLLVRLQTRVPTEPTEPGCQHDSAGSEDLGAGWLSSLSACDEAPKYNKSDLDFKGSQRSWLCLVSAVRHRLCWQCSQALASPLFILWKQNNDSSIIHGQKGIQLEATAVAAAMGGWSWAEWKIKYRFCFKKTRNTLQKLYLIFWSKFFELLLTKWSRLFENKLNTLQSPCLSSPLFQWRKSYWRPQRKEEWHQIC